MNNLWESSGFPAACTRDEQQVVCLRLLGHDHPVGTHLIHHRVLAGSVQRVLAACVQMPIGGLYTGDLTKNVHKNTNSDTGQADN